MFSSEKDVNDWNTLFKMNGYRISAVSSMRKNYKGLQLTSGWQNS
ncbi:hypothetical protein SAMN05444362_12330 [Dysgonomonas macrotermitis]|uniref:Uncharacterized protein n=1 Tax=Dysgonomonas macrotermitis TaxID=1346286 RepID=A0A1M5JF09_9BACT|nr:hypothetical protein SAMN05444362_12330 [Dysgonomonas macrotermitis]